MKSARSQAQRRHSGSGAPSNRWDGDNDAGSSKPSPHIPRISSRTGGFEGDVSTFSSGIVLSSSNDDDDEDHTVVASNTIQSFPEFSALQGVRYQSSNPRTMNAVQTTQRKSKQQQQHAVSKQQRGNGLFRLFGAGNDETIPVKGPIRDAFAIARDRTHSSTTTSRVSEAASKLLEESDSVSPIPTSSIRVHQQRHNPRFRLPDEAKTKRIKDPDSPLTYDQTDAAVASPLEQLQAGRIPSQRQHNTQTGFELSMSGRVHEVTATGYSVDDASRRRQSALQIQRHDEMLLTEEGLKAHERKGWKPSRTEALPSNRTLTQKPSLPQLRVNQQTSPSRNVKNSNSTKIRQRGIFGRHSYDDDLTAFSLAPLNTMENLQLSVPAPEKLYNRSKSDPGLSLHKKGGSSLIKKLLRRKEDPVTTLLERERHAAMEAKRQQESLERLEKLRIEQKRQEYLMEQRVLENNVISGGLLDPYDDNSFSDLHSGDQHATNKKRLGANHTQSTGSTTRAPFPLCVVCKVGERTHIATPCMHLALCEDCAALLRRQKRGCAICLRKDVKFAAVSF